VVDQSVAQGKKKKYMRKVCFFLEHVVIGEVMSYLYLQLEQLLEVQSVKVEEEYEEPFQEEQRKHLEEA
jgi:hypothetical protein